MENLVAFIQYVGLVIGLTYLMTKSVIMLPVRVLISRIGRLAAILVYCPACFGFWVGVALGYTHFSGYLLEPLIVKPLVSGVTATAIMALVTGAFEVDNWLTEQPDQGQDDETKEEKNG